MIEYAIFIVMVIVTICFTWLCSPNREREKRYAGKRRLNDDESHGRAAKAILSWLILEAITSNPP